MSNLPSKTKPRERCLTHLTVVVFVLASLWGTNRYEYGTSDHALVVPMLKHSLCADLYPGDYVLAKDVTLYTVLWPAMAALARPFGRQALPAMFFVGYCAALYMAFLAMYRIGRVLFRRRDAAILGMFFVLFPEDVLGGVGAIDPQFYTRTVSLPFILWAFFFYFAERRRLCAFLAGVAFLIHPLSGSYAIAMLALAALGQWRLIGWRRLAQSAGVLGLTVAPLIVWRLAAGASDLPLGLADPNWLAILRMRSTHHVFPSQWPAMLFLRAGLLVAAFLVSWRHRPARRHHRAVVWMAGAVAAMCLTGYVCTELLPLGLAVQMQFFRSFRLLVLLSAIYFGNYALAECDTGRPGRALLAIALGAALIVAAGDAIFMAAAVGAFAFFMVLRWTSVYFGWGKTGPGRIALLLLPAMMMGTFASHYHDWEPPRPTMERDRDWLALQKWAREHTPIDAAFIVPPGEKGFRIASERTVYAEWKDGTLAFFSLGLGEEWRRRMETMGVAMQGTEPSFIGYDSLTKRRFLEISAELHAAGAREVYVVVAEDRSLAGWRCVYENDDYRVYAAPVGSTP